VDRQFLEELVVWHHRERGTLRAAGTDVELRGPSTAYDKNLVALEVVSPSRAVSVVVWDSGEYEVITCLADDGWEPAISTDTLPDPQSVAGLLDRATAEFRGRT
jgi:hypothetical protein